MDFSTNIGIFFIKKFLEVKLKKIKIKIKITLKYDLFILLVPPLLLLFMNDRYNKAKNLLLKLSYESPQHLISLLTILYHIGLSNDVCNYPIEFSVEKG